MTDTQTVTRPVGPTPLRTVKVPDETWDAAMARAKQEAGREGLSGVIRRALERYAAGEDI